MLKAAGEHGRDVFIVHSAGRARKGVGGFEGQVLPQELCPGSTEYDDAPRQGRRHPGRDLHELRVRSGGVRWLFVEEHQDCRKSHENIPNAPRYDGSLLTSSRVSATSTTRCAVKACIFEVNARVGADIACDVPRRRAAAFFRKLDPLPPSIPPSTIS